MTAGKRILSVFLGIIMLLSAAGMILYPNIGYAFAILFLDISLILYGLRLLTYYLTMARFMVGGISTFYKSIFVLDVGLFIFGLDEIPRKYAMLYLIFCLAFSGVVDILRSLEARRLSAPWRLHIAYGFVKFGTAIACLFFLNSTNVLSYLYAIGLIHSATFQFLNAFRKSAIVYIA